MNTNMDTVDRLHRIAPTPGSPVSEDVIQQDLARGRAAVQHRRRQQAWAAGGIGGLALAGAVMGGVLLPAWHNITTQAASTGSASHSVTTEPVMQLVSYTGTQPDGYHLGKVPFGFTVETSDATGLILAPTDTKTPPSTDGMVDFRGKIVISQGSFAYTTDKREVTINGKPALIALTSDSQNPATEVQFSTGKHRVNIQICDTIHLTDQQIIDFAQNITVTGNPIIIRG